MEARHTATPWHLVDNGMYFEIVVPWKSMLENVDQYCPKICSVSYKDNDGITGRPNAEFIVRACNSFDDMLNALKLFVKYDDADDEDGVALMLNYADAIAAARSALAKAGAQP